MPRAAVSLVVLSLLAALCAGGATASDPPVPLRVQQTIEREYPGLAVFPERLPAGYRYAGWARQDPLHGYSIWVTKRGPAGTVISQLAFTVSRQPCNLPSPMATFRINGHTIRAVWTNADSMAWLCIKPRGGRSIVISGNNGRPRTDAALIAYAKPAD